MKKQLLLLALMMLPIVANAATLVDGIYYNLYPSVETATVTSGPSKYVGTVTIPGTFTYGGKTYTVDEIGQKAFYGCSDLKVVVLPNTIKYIFGLAFQDCTSLEAITFPDGLKEIYWQAFFNCSSLKSIIIPASVTSISGDSFSGCTGLTAINVDSKNTVYHSVEGFNCIIETATNTLVQGCKETVIPSGVTVIGEDAFAYMTNIVNCHVPEGITMIESSAYNACSGIKNVTIANSVTNIAYYAFNYCTSMESLTIGKGIKKIESTAFQNCTGLKKVTIKALTPPEAEIDDEYGDDPFMEYGEGSFRSNVSLYVPASSLEAYKNDSYWGGFKEVVALPNKCETPVITLKDGQVTFSCETEDVEYKASISREFTGEDISPDGAYTISVYATKADFEDSDIATMQVDLGLEYAKGDIDKDGQVTIADAVSVVNILMNGGGSGEESSEEDQAVDLGLSVKWAPTNVGASTPEEYGGLYAWGELSEKDGNYTWANYALCNGSETTLTKYCSNSYYGTVDNKTVLDAEDDVARQKYGNNKEWRSPTKFELDELVNQCTWKEEQLNDVWGYRVTGPNGNSIFLPYAGQKIDSGLVNRGGVGFLSTATLSSDTSRYAYYFYDAQCGNMNYTREQGLSVRPVYAGKE